jgi:phosphoglycerate kinase
VVRTLDDLVAELDGDPTKGRCVFVRADLNVPLEQDGSGATTITDDGRIRASVPTLQRLRDAGARVVVAAHLGRPKPGADNSKYSLAPVAARLGELLGTEVRLMSLGDEAQQAVDRLISGGVVLLENIRFDPRETSKDDTERAALARELAGLTGAEGVFVSDGFGVVHRKQASVYDIARELPAYAGGLVQLEVEVLRKLTQDPERPYAVVLGGSKVSDKLLVIESLLPQVDSLLVGGGMCFTFLAAQGYGVGDSLLEDDQIATCRRLLADVGNKIVLPVDVVVADDFSADATTRTVPVEKIPDGWKGLDIGPESVAAFSQVLASAKTVFWNGPMGVFELAPFAEGTRGVAQAIIDTTRGEGDGTPGFSVVGGGDSAAAVRALGLPEDGFSHISTGGGASLEYLEGKVLPGLAVLEEQ